MAGISKIAIVKPNFKSRFSYLLTGLGILAMISYGWFVARRWYRLVDLCNSPMVSIDERIDRSTRKELDEVLGLIVPRPISPPLMSSAVFVLFGVNNIRNEIVISPQDSQIRVDSHQDLGYGGRSTGYIIFSHSNDGLEIIDNEFICE